MPEAFLDLKVTFKPRRVTIALRNESQAQEYLRLISERRFIKSMELNPTRNGCSVSVDLPSRVLWIEARTSYHGICFFTKEEKFARQWKEALILWDSVYVSKDEGYLLYVHRDISNLALDRLLKINSDSAAYYSKDTGNARPSKNGY